MDEASQPFSAAQQCVTASDLVRHFGVWQERAARAPVYIMHRGRPRLALTSLDLMDALCAPHGAAANDQSAFTALLDAIDDVALVADRTGAILATSRALRSRLGDAVRIGSDTAGLAITGGEFLSAAIARVASSGIAEQVEVIPARYPSRRVACQVSPFPGGCLVRAHDLTADEQLGAAEARAAAVTAALEAVGATTVRINLRGYLIDPPASLARMIGASGDALAVTRFTALIDVSGRVAVGEAIEGVIADRAPRRVSTSLLIRGAEALPATIGLTALRIALRVEEVIATITPAPAPAPGATHTS